MVTIHRIGIRHHSPSSARHVVRVLDQVQPDVVLIEGPKDAMVLLDATPDLATFIPPVAILVYATHDFTQSCFYPFALYSPEWVAMSWCQRQRTQVPVQFMDLAIGSQFLLAETVKTPVVPIPVQNTGVGSALQTFEELVDMPFDDWWEGVGETVTDSTALFTEIEQIMTTARELDAQAHELDSVTQAREATMRQTIRTAIEAGAQTIVVIGGALHMPALIDIEGTVRTDEALLATLPVQEVVPCWVPWSNARLSLQSGYGAGIMAPGWTQHVYDTVDKAAIVDTWLVQAAQLFRDTRITVPPANVQEAVALAQVLQTFQPFPVPTLTIMHDVIQAVFTQGDAAALTLIRDRLEVNDRLGVVPEQYLQTPLVHDFLQHINKLRLPDLQTQPVHRKLDLRKPIDAARSYFLHKLTLLEVPWGTVQHVSLHHATIQEDWVLSWVPDLLASLIEKTVWGTTITEATTNYVLHCCAQEKQLLALTTLLETAVLADIAEAVPVLLQRVRNVVATTPDITQLIDALVPLGQIHRYRSIRPIDLTLLQPIIQTLTTRVLVELPMLCRHLDTTSTQALVPKVLSFHNSIMAFQDTALSQRWLHSIQALAMDSTVHGLLQGRFARLLLDLNVLTAAEVQHLFVFALSPANPPELITYWIEGCVAGSTSVLLHHDVLWAALNVWLQQLTDDAFLVVLPALRKAFQQLSKTERTAAFDKVTYMIGFTGQVKEADTDTVSTQVPDSTVAVVTALKQLFGLE